MSDLAISLIHEADSTCHAKIYCSTSGGYLCRENVCRRAVNSGYLGPLALPKQYQIFIQINGISYNDLELSLKPTISSMHFRLRNWCDSMRWSATSGSPDSSYCFSKSWHSSGPNYRPQYQSPIQQKTTAAKDPLYC